MLIKNKNADLPQSKALCRRWNHAAKMSKKPGSQCIPKDQVTKNAIDYLKTPNKALHPEIHTARQIFLKNGLKRAELEARLLVGQADTEIADHCSISPETVSIYSKLFFCVRERANDFEWLFKHTVGEPYFSGFEDHHLRQFWAWFALHGIPEVLDEVIRTYREELKPTDNPTLSVYLRPGSRVCHYLKHMLADCITPYFPPQNEWELEFVRYCQFVRSIPLDPDVETALSQNTHSHISFAYFALIGTLTVEFSKWRLDWSYQRSPVNEIKIIREILSSLASMNS
jgi:hypothetical protein